jgi:hypothetical protein
MKRYPYVILNSVGDRLRDNIGQIAFLNLNFLLNYFPGFLNYWFHLSKLIAVQAIKTLLSEHLKGLKVIPRHLCGAHRYAMKTSAICEKLSSLTHLP